MLSIKNLSVDRGGSTILRGLSLEIGAREVHVIMGPNGSGKSTLAHTLMGHPAYTVTAGEIVFTPHTEAATETISLAGMSPQQRAQSGLYLAFQQPPAIAGVQMRSFLQSLHVDRVLDEHGVSLDEARKDKALRQEVSPLAFRAALNPQLDALGLKYELMDRSINEGYSGGERKKAEILQMELLKPQLAVLDEFDSGVDVDALKLLCSRINALRERTGMSLLIITHNSRIFDYITPDRVHLLAHGVIVKSGGLNLVERIEKSGFAGGHIDEEEIADDSSRGL